MELSLLPMVYASFSQTLDVFYDAILNAITITKNLYCLMEVSATSF